MLTGEAGRPTTASASVAIITDAGTIALNAAAKPRSEKAPRREIISDLIFSLIVTSYGKQVLKRKAAREELGGYAVTVLQGTS
jgi:hypothetical protein